MGTPTGLMGDLPLTLDLLYRRARDVFPHKTVVTARQDGLQACRYGDWAERTACLAGGLEALEVSQGGRVGAICWSTADFLELYFGVPCAGRILHTINPRFTPEQIVSTVNEAEDEALFVHTSLLGVVVGLLDRLPTVRSVIQIGETVGFDAGEELSDLGGADQSSLSYGRLLADSKPMTLSVSDERAAAVLCYTGGTTGAPKGILSSHRSLVLHAMAVTAAGAIGIHERDVAMPVVPLFHANSVGFAHAAVATGATLVLPGSDLSGPALADLIETCAVSVTCGVPTIWTSVLPHLAGRHVPGLRTIISGASAVPPSLSESYGARVGVPLTQIWGMTETSPLGTIATITSDLDDEDEATLADARSGVGRPVLGLEHRLVDDDGAVLSPTSGRSGELQVRGPWVASGYFAGRSPESFTADGWLRTGDIASVDQHGNLRIVDRIKDVIKSGGEWISSVALENYLVSHASVVDAAVVGVTDAKWGERPVAYVVSEVGDDALVAELQEMLRLHLPGWWVPERIEFVAELPRTSVGKVAKSKLRNPDHAGR